MKSKNTGPPRLNELINQRKQYNGHLKRMLQIKSKKNKSTNGNSMQKGNIKEGVSHETSHLRIPKIKGNSERYQNLKSQSVQIHYNNRQNKKSKLHNFKLFEIKKENQRLQQKIKTSISRLNCWRDQVQEDELQNLKKRIRRFQMTKKSKKIVLKTQKSLEQLNMKKPLYTDFSRQSEKSKLSTVSPSRLNKTQSAQSQISKIQLVLNLKQKLRKSLVKNDQILDTQDMPFFNKRKVEKVQRRSFSKSNEQIKQIKESQREQLNTQQNEEQKDKSKLQQKVDNQEQQQKFHTQKQNDKDKSQQFHEQIVEEQNNQKQNKQQQIYEEVV